MRLIFPVLAAVLLITSCAEMPTKGAAFREKSEADPRIVIAINKKEFGPNEIVYATIFNRGSKNIEMGVCPVILERLDHRTGEWSDAWELPEACILPMYVVSKGKFGNFPVKLRGDAPGEYRIRLPHMSFAMGVSVERESIYPVHTPSFVVRGESGR